MLLTILPHLCPGKNLCPLSLTPSFLQTPLGSVCSWPASLLLLASLRRFTWISFPNELCLGPIALLFSPLASATLFNYSHVASLNLFQIKIGFIILSEASFSAMKSSIGMSIHVQCIYRTACSHIYMHYVYRIYIFEVFCMKQEKQTTSIPEWQYSEWVVWCGFIISLNHSYSVSMLYTKMKTRVVVYCAEIRLPSIWFWHFTVQSKCILKK